MDPASISLAAGVWLFAELDASGKLVDATAGGIEDTDALDDAIGNDDTAGTLPVEDND